MGDMGATGARGPPGDDGMDGTSPSLAMVQALVEEAVRNYTEQQPTACQLKNIINKA